MKTKRKRFGKNDAWFLGIVGVMLVVFVILYGAFGKQGASVLVTVDGSTYGTYSLAQNQRVEIIIDGATTNILEIQDGKADMVEADCPDKLCVHQKAISKNNETIICLPNKVVVQVTGGEESEFDSVAK